MSRRIFDIAGSCEIPASARSVSANVTVTSAQAPGHLRLSPAAGLAPSSSTINFAAGRTRANNAILTLDGAGQVAVQNGGAGSVHVILDVNGWFE